MKRNWSIGICGPENKAINMFFFKDMDRIGLHRLTNNLNRNIILFHNTTHTNGHVVYAL